MIDQIPESDSEIKFWIYLSLLRKLAYLDHFAHDASFFGPQTFPVSLSVPILASASGLALTAFGLFLSLGGTPSSPDVFESPIYCAALSFGTPLGSPIAPMELLLNMWLTSQAVLF